ncbi:MAG: folate hydrolase, partial [Candidatus Binatia bacterium]
MTSPFCRIFIVLIAAVSLTAQSIPAEKSFLGFSPDGTKSQKSLELKFDANLNADNLRNWMKRLSARPHHVGSAYDKENAEFILSLYKSWGYDAQIENFDVLFPTPKTRLVEMTSPEKFALKLNEPEVPGDSTSGQQSEQLPTYNAYSIDGDVTGPLVYVNYGIPADYDRLAESGIDVKGK